ncbi:(2Fe-2S)-binding protein [Alicyclobacillus fastidiosus]|uniref:(2Fe-2S)-binding protein n=1 Tax=Alicyclobacillus fastidiosus TaxID=392011 RepID=A0ABY6ZED7_9BACL|nr:(2Fe-2S)-binding protein [Alicyclobacillus fastidiosus]WAH40496.1 (2Fe-2S)-binding protein [Alicyclobacillus fastidiosus]GMA61912.1 (2Fe-2S)-binding protein [Alicyclobacillus fastidiosus]
MHRILSHPILGPRKEAQTATFQFDGNVIEGYIGEPIAAALLANGRRLLRRHEESGTPRGFYCAIGHCMECRVEVAGRGTVRACLTPVEDGMVVFSGRQLPNEITGRTI